jgi:D-lyxose ketol-isomerase
MKRSTINARIKEGEEFFASHNFYLPPWAHWSLDEWSARAQDAAEVVDTQLGWDLTDFGGGDFERRGLLLFTIRNGKPDGAIKPYCEKAMIVKEDQETPYHFHWHKIEDIINRGGGNLVIETVWADEREELADKAVDVTVDGFTRRVAVGEPIVLTPGESITLVPYLYHRFYAEAGSGSVLAGEVSTVNDDANDNRFLEQLGRFPTIDEDEPPHRLLVSDYALVGSRE